MLSRGCIALLVIVEEVPTTAPGLEDVSIVHEFPNVFPPMPTMMPPGKEIEFVISVVRGTTLILKAPYWIAPVKLRELLP